MNITITYANPLNLPPKEAAEAKARFVAMIFGGEAPKRKRGRPKGSKNKPKGGVDRPAHLW